MSRSSLVLGPPRVSRARGCLEVRCALGPGPDLWLRIEGDASVVDRVRPSIEPFLPIALLAAGIQDADLEIRSEVDPVRLANLRANLVPLMTFALGLGETTIRVEPTAPDGRAGDGVSRPGPTPGASVPPPGSLALAFSCGLDSLYALRRLEAQGDRPTCLVNADAGAHGTHAGLATRRRARVQRAADELGLPLIRIDTDFHRVAPLRHQDVHVFRNIPALHALQGAVAAVAYSTTYPLGPQVFAEAPGDPDQLGPAPAIAMAWSALPVIEVGYDLARPDRMRLLADDPFVRRHLDVCMNPAYQVGAGPDDPVNCGACLKCRRELVVLDHLARLEAYAARFDLTAWRREGGRFLDAIRERGGPNNAAILAFLARPGSDIP